MSENMLVYMLNMEFLNNLHWTRGKQVNGFSDLNIIMNSISDVNKDGVKRLSLWGLTLQSLSL